MVRVDRSLVTRGATLMVAALTGVTLWAQATPPAPTNDLPNPYQTVEGFFKMPEGRTWGSTSAVDVSPDGKFIWVAERCGANSCWDAAAGKTSASDVVLKFDPASGKLLGSFGAGMFVFPHGIHVDRQGNVWVTDGNDNLPRRRPGQPAGRAAAPGTREGDWPSGLQVQSGREAAADARQARRQSARPAGRSGVVLPAQRRDHLSERRHPRRRGPRRRQCAARAGSTAPASS